MKNHTPYFSLSVSILFLIHKKDSGVKKWWKKDW